MCKLRNLGLAVCLLSSASAVHALDVSFRGVSQEVLSFTPDRNSGLESVYVAYDASQIQEMIVSGAGNVSGVSKYSNLGGGYAVPVDYSVSGGNVILTAPAGDTGYIIEADGRTVCIWLVDYLHYRLAISSAHASEEQECENTRIDIVGSGEPVYYYSIDGRQCELSREIDIDYLNLAWDEQSESFIQERITKTVAHISNPIVISPPLYCNSTFSIYGDRFLKAWGMEQHVESELVYANGLDVRTTVEQTNLPDDDDPDADASNMIKTETQGIGGSAPADISFRAFTTDAVIHNEWQIARDQDFEHIDYRFNEQNLDYTFTEEGTYYVRFVGSNADGSCETAGETYTVGIGSSDLRIPNAFTPNEDGVNDVWKVAYRSLLEFSCTIFDRYGNELFHFNDPTQGWDGKYKGKYVKPGVYFYVIEAKGADGTRYRKGGDINLIRSKRYSNSSSTE